MATNTVPFPRPTKKVEPQIVKPDGKSVFAIDDGTREVTLVNTYGKVICKIHFRTQTFRKSLSRWSVWI